MNDWPCLIIGFMMLFYWARVMKLALKAKKRTGNLGNLFPTEPLGRALRLIWFPVIFLWFIIPLASFRIDYRPAVLVPLADLWIGRWIALAIAVGAFWFTLVCWRKMGSSWRMGINPDDRTTLIFTGAYAYMRHPIYALSSLLMLCTMVIIPSWPMLIVGVLHILLLQWEARREEAYLISIHGQAYQTYALRTGRFVPRLFGRG